MITKNINGIQFWKIGNFAFVEQKIQISLHGFLNEEDSQYMKLFTIDCPTSVIQNILDYSTLVSTLENWIINNVIEFQTEEE